MTTTGKPTLYKVREPRRGGWDPIGADVFMDALFASQLVNRPECPEQPDLECYCQNESCVVRHVVVRMKLFGEPQPKLYRCPVCGEQLERHGYRKSIMLVPVTTEAAKSP